MTPATPFLLYGTREPEPEVQLLSAGPLSAELVGGNLRTIRYAGVEVLRAVSFLVRDRDWGTCLPDIADLSVTNDGDRFSVGYTVRFSAPDGAALACRATIEGDGRSLVFDAAFTPDRDFETARTGFAVLHPVVGLAGQAVSVEHSDASVERSVFPDLLEPWQPFKDIAALTHEALPGVLAECRMQGDVFEMEDQRNWTDGSYKTYVRPLALPWPYRLKAGETMRQSVSLTLHGEAEVKAELPAGPVRLTIGAPSGLSLPAIGLGLRPECRDEEIANAALATEIGAGHLICHFDPDAGHGLDTLKGFAEIAAALRLPVTLECFVPCRGDLDAELSGIAALVRESGLALASLAVSPSVDRQSTPPGSVWPDCPPLGDVYAAAKRAFPGVPLGGGMFSYFTELNRKRVPADGLAYITHCTNPIVHAADDLSVMQTFEALRFVTRSVRAIYGGMPYRIGPSTIAMRQNPYGSATKPNPGGSRIAMADSDPRHNGLFGAAWTLGYAATVADAGLKVLTLSTLAGPFGPVAEAGEPVGAGRPRPLFHVLKWLGGLAGADVVPVESTAPDRVLALGGRIDTTITLLVANITPAVQTVVLPGNGRLTVLDEAWLRSGAGEPRPAAHGGGEVGLPPYAVARLEIE